MQPQNILGQTLVRGIIYVDYGAAQSSRAKGFSATVGRVDVGNYEKMISRAKGDAASVIVAMEKKKSQKPGCTMVKQQPLLNMNQHYIEALMLYAWLGPRIFRVL